MIIQIYQYGKLVFEDSGTMEKINIESGGHSFARILFKNNLVALGLGLAVVCKEPSAMPKP